MRRRLLLVLSSLLTVVALAAGGWLLDPAGSRTSAGREVSAPMRPSTTGAVLYASVRRAMVDERSVTYVWSGTSGGGTTQAGTGALRLLAGGTPGHSFDADVTLTSPGTGKLRAVLLPGASYLALPPAKGIPRSRPWLRVAAAPRTALGRELLPVGEELRAAVDPAQSVGLLLAAGRVTETGASTVEGVVVTGYRATVDLRRAARLTEDPGLTAQYRAMTAAGVRSLDYRLWVDPGGLPLRVHADVPRTTGVFSLTGVFRGWGQRTPIEAPTAKQVFDADKIKG